MAQLEKAKVFMSGRSQTVRIPAQFRCEQRGLYPARPVLSQSPGSVAEILAALYQPRGRETTAFQALTDEFLASINVLSWGRDEAEAYGLLRAKLERAGRDCSRRSGLPRGPIAFQAENLQGKDLGSG